MGVTARENYRRKHGRKTNGPAFVQMHYYFLDSEAWHRLSPMARCAYLELARVYNGINNGFLGMSVRRLAEQLPCAINSATRALTELELAGFAEPVTIGTFSRRDRMATEYRLTNYRCDRTGMPPTKAYSPNKRWKGKVTVANFDSTVSNFDTPPRPNGPTVSNIATVTPFQRPATVSNTDTHIDIYHTAKRGQPASLSVVESHLASASARLPWSTPSVVEIERTCLKRESPRQSALGSGPL